MPGHDGRAMLPTMQQPVWIDPLAGALPVTIVSRDMRFVNLLQTSVARYLPRVRCTQARAGHGVRELLVIDATTASMNGPVLGPTVLLVANRRPGLRHPRLS